MLRAGGGASIRTRQSEKTIFLGKELIAKGEGTSKHEAQVDAARAAIQAKGG